MTTNYQILQNGITPTPLITTDEIQRNNFVYESYGGCYQVQSILGENQIGLRYPFAKATGVYDIVHIKPLWITRDWLLAFGFINENFGWTKDGFMLFDYNYGNDELGMCLKISNYNDDVPQIKYIHQLQNTFHAVKQYQLLADFNPNEFVFNSKINQK